MKHSQLDSIHALWDALDGKVRPWVAEDGAGRCIVATATYRGFVKQSAPLPEGIVVKRRPWTGQPKTVPKKLQRIGSKMATQIWPDDGLLTMRMPKLACVFEGRCDFRAGDYTMSIPAGHFVVIPPGVPHPDGSRGHTDGPGSCSILWLTLWNDVLYCWICRSKDGGHLPTSPAYSCFVQDSQVNNYFYALSAEAVQQEAGYDEVCRSLNRVIWAVIHRRVARGQFMIRARFKVGLHVSTDPDDAPIPTAKDYVRAHLNERLTLESVAQNVHMSRAQFARRFHEETGQTFNAFVTQCRLQEATRLLEETNWSFSSISDVAGLTQVHLRELFKRHHGQSPSEFRSTVKAKKRDDNFPDETIITEKEQEGAG